MDKQIGVFLCQGCGIGEALDLKALADVARSEYHVADCAVQTCLCGDEGREAVKKAIESGGNKAFVVGACSGRTMTEAFAFDPTRTVVERVNLREHVVWTHKPNDEDTQMLAEDCLRMGIVKAQKTEPLEPNLGESSDRLLVIGGGQTGLAAAIEAALAGRDVILIEKDAKLGGFAARVHRKYPTADPFRDLEPPTIGALVKAADSSERIHVFTGAQVEEITGQPGMFEVTFVHGQTRQTERVGAVVVATGFRPYDPTKLTHLGFGAHPNVITNVALEDLARGGRIVRPSDGQDARSVAFIQCAGSRDENHLPYCSGVCCCVSLKQALYVREQNRDARAFVFYKDLRASGEYELFYKRVQEDEGVFLTKGEVVEIRPHDEHRVAVVVDSALLGERMTVVVDLVVLATGLVPATADNPTLNLTYRKGKELPVVAGGFCDSEFICFPYESQRTGIYAAGAVRHPMDGAAAARDGAGAALKALQCTRSVARGAAVHPRSGDLSWPSFFLQRCTQCKRCTEECPFGALDEDAKGTPKVNINRCRRCGICLGACPERIVSFKSYSVDMIASMVKAIDVPEEDEEKPRVLAFMCENDAYPVLDQVGHRRIAYDPMTRVIPVRCLGSVNLVWIADALSKGIDGVILIGCQFGTDYQCHFIHGSEIATKRLDNLKETLGRLALEPERVAVVQLAMSDVERLPKILDEFAETIRRLGPNPYKGL